MTDPIVIMKQQVGKAAAEYIESNSIIGLGTGSTTAYAIEHIGKRLQSGSLKNIIGITTSFQAEVLAKKYNIPLSTLDMVDHIDIAIDGADEVDPRKNLIKGGGAAHTQEKIVDSLAKKFIVVVDGNKIVDSLGSTVPVPVEVIPKALTPVMKKLKELGGLVEWPAKLAEFDELKDDARRSVHEYGDGDDRKMMDGVLEEADRAIADKDPRMLDRAEEQLRSLHLQMLQKDPAFWVGFLQHLASQRSKFPDQRRAEQLFNEGAMAMKRSDVAALQSVVRELLQMLPPEDRNGPGGGLGSGVI